MMLPSNSSDVQLHAALASSHMQPVHAHGLWRLASGMLMAACPLQEAGSAFDAAMRDGQDGDAASRVIAQITEATPALLAAGTPCSLEECGVACCAAC